jgi:hypothetical protein
VSVTNPASVVSRAELTAAIGTCSRRARSYELADPLGLDDLAFVPDVAVSIIRRRIVAKSTPAPATIFPWPKDGIGWRPMIHLDPLDSVVYHAVTGRFIRQIEHALDRDHVLSARAVGADRSWQLEKHWIATNDRRSRSESLLDAQPHGALVAIDIANYFPSVQRDLVARVLSLLPLPPPTLAFLMIWFLRLARNWSVPGLPIGPEASSVIGNALLMSADAVLRTRPAEFLRYMDDTWVFLPNSYGSNDVIAAYEEHCSSLGLELNAEKTKILTGSDRYEAVRSGAIDYVSDDLTAEDDDGVEAARELFMFAAESPVEEA